MSMGTRPAQELCPEKAGLQSKWADATNAYARLVESWTNQIGTLPKAEYERLREHVETARKLSETLRKDLDLHIETHGC